MENKETNLTPEWFKANGWRNVGTNTFNKSINDITYYLVCNSWCVTSIAEALKRSISSNNYMSDNPAYTLFKTIAGISSVQALEMITLEGRECEKDTYIKANEDDQLISRDWLPNNGWKRTFTGAYHKCINNVWYEMEYTDFDCDYILRKEIARLQTVEELEKLTK